MDYSLAQIEEYAAQRARQQRNAWNAAHPELVKQQRIRTAANLLRRNGYFVMKEQFPAPPWTDLQIRAIQQAILANQEGLRDE